MKQSKKIKLENEIILLEQYYKHYANRVIRGRVTRIGISFSVILVVLFRFHFTSTEISVYINDNNVYYWYFVCLVEIIADTWVLFTLKKKNLLARMSIEWSYRRKVDFIRSEIEGWKYHSARWASESIIILFVCLIFLSISFGIDSNYNKLKQIGEYIYPWVYEMFVLTIFGSIARIFASPKFHKSTEDEKIIRLVLSVVSASKLNPEYER